MRCVQKLTHSSIAVLGNKFHDARVITVLISMYQRGRGKLVEELISRGQATNGHSRQFWRYLSGRLNPWHNIVLFGFLTFENRKLARTGTPASASAALYGATHQGPLSLAEDIDLHYRNVITQYIGPQNLWTPQPQLPAAAEYSRRGAGARAGGTSEPMEVFQDTDTTDGEMEEGMSTD
eukprot:1148973-Pelagomonas_calceolata.AAC.2